ncbi:MAG: glycosyltransferase family 4 protein, partial [Mariprofundus sp.]|nr:glycosyltransferase family 4 protein [Mariprofundus sp.]
QWSVTFASTAATTEHMADLEPLTIRSVPIAVNDSGFDLFINELQPDMVLFDRFTTEEQFGWRVEKNCPDAMRVIETIDLHCLRQARQLQFRRNPEVVLHVDHTDLYNEIAIREIAAIHRSDLSLLISDYEMELLRTQFAVHPDIIHLCPFMFEKQHLHLSSPSFEDRAHFISIGNFRHAPNWDAVLWMKQQIWPLIRSRLPEAQLHVYGAYAPPKAWALHQPDRGFHVLGRAEQVSTVMQQARVCLAPLRFGAGIKTKLADAMLNGTPNVTTGIGIEGMQHGLSWAGDIADSAETFADAAVSLYLDTYKWVQAQNNGFRIVQKLFNAHSNGEALIHRLLQVKKTLASHRQQHFTGLMLKHHHQRSTEFMSRWIESKNKLAALNPKG